MLMTHHKAPHRPWEPDEKHAHMYDDIEIPVPEIFDDDYATRPAAEAALMRVGRDMTFTDLKAEPPTGLPAEEEKHWAYQRYIKDYLRCVASVDDNVGRLLDWLDDTGLAENTIVIYTSDQGFFLGDAGLDVPNEMQGKSFRTIPQGTTPDGWRESIYYRYWMHLGDHGVAAHYGVRTATHKLIHYYGKALGTAGSIDRDTDPYWELFDLETDPNELNNVYGKPDFAEVQRELTEELERLRVHYGDTDHP